METRAPYTLIGLFVVAAIGAVFGFVFWLHNTGGLGERTVYRVRFENTVSGLLTGAAVLFNGIRVGEVTDLGLNPDNPHEVMATIAVVATTPVRVDTQAGLEFQGLTGVPVISLRGGMAEAAPLASTKDGASVLVADSDAGQSMTEAARKALRRLDGLLADNSGDLKSAIANLNTFTGALARNSDRVDNILSGLDRMTGAGPAKSVATTYDLKAAVTFPQPHNGASDKASKSQLVVVEPTAVVALDTQRIIVGPGIADGPTPDNAQWSDTIPKLLQAKIIQSFENANYLGAVARPMDGLTPDYQLLIDVRAFQVSTSPTDAAKPVAHVGFAAKILGNNGRIIGSRTFNAEVAATDIGAPGAAAALDAAFGKAAVDLVVWTVGVI
jgi:phospholipid/cholesterol/gamma-HCH transport system substrate-binding protein